MMITTNKKPCGASNTCLHATCRICGKPVRSSWHPLEDHQGTVQGFPTVRLCKKHRNQGRSNTLSDSEMAWLRTAHPHAYRYHTDRRRRGVPPEGYRIRGER